MAAGSLLVEEAGGIVTTYASGTYDVYGSEIIAANPALHGRLAEAINAAVAELAETA
jgi:fructose-1,6-bisphosphatase/inositol monophosphatase family enzyme